MPVDFYITLLFVLVVVLGSIFFAQWWNKRHGLDKRGNPIKRSPQHDTSDANDGNLSHR